ncbi:MAG: hypothetical protein ABW122_03565, partial [Ilumatobacteraceae bacterium]
AAALAELARTVPDRPRFLVGYSFGAGVALGVDDAAATVVVAPPLAMMPVPRPPTMPTLVLVPALDQYSPPAVIAPLVAGWPAVTVDTIAGADHFLVGHTVAVADRATQWLTAQALAP